MTLGIGPSTGTKEPCVGDSATGGSEVVVSDYGQVWRVSWHPPPDPPPGTPHGAAAICIAGGQVVLVSSDGQRWGPAWRPSPAAGALDRHTGA
jgi:hypothetical protein